MQAAFVVSGAHDGLDLDDLALEHEMREEGPCVSLQSIKQRQQNVYMAMEGCRLNPSVSYKFLTGRCGQSALLPAPLVLCGWRGLAGKQEGIPMPQEPKT